MIMDSTHVLSEDTSMVTVTVSRQSTDLSEARRPYRQPAKISLNKAMNLFFDRDDDKLVRGTRKDYELALFLLEEYINSFGSVLLRAADVAPTLASPKNGPVSKRYDPASLSKFFRGFALFFLQFKLNAPKEIKETFIEIIEEFVEWLRAKGHLSKEFQCNFELADKRSNHLALHAFGVLVRTIANRARSSKMIEDIHDGEPFYVVSRVKSGKIWFIYLANKCYDELGPVNVPRGVSDIIEPGWLVDCAFSKFDGKWQITTVRSIMPI
jgi:hypothetical protein